MGGVDRADKRVLSYSTARKSLKWYTKLIFHCIDVCIVNGNVLFNLTTIKGNDAMRIADFQTHHTRSQYALEELEACPSKDQVTKYDFMRAIVEESIDPLSKALKQTHRNNRRKKPWSKLTAEERRNKDFQSCWVPHLDNDQVRLTRTKVPAEYRATPDRRVKHGLYIQKDKTKK